MRWLRAAWGVAKSTVKYVRVLGIIACVLGFVIGFSYLQPAAVGAKSNLIALNNALAAGDVARLEVLVEDGVVFATRTDGTMFYVDVPAESSSLADTVRIANGASVAVEFDSQSSKKVVRVLITTVLPLVLLVFLFSIFGSSGQGSGGIWDFSRIGKRSSAKSETTFKDVAGVDEAVTELSEIVSYLTDPTQFNALGALPPKGVLLHGPPGCGKTLLARAVAGEAQANFFSVSGSEFVESLVGVGAARVRDLFSRARSSAPAIIFIDEIDAIARSRTSGGSDERDQTLNQLLVEMDGFEVNAAVVVMAATNRVDMLDQAVLRQGRFDRHINIDRPDLGRREAILRLHASRRPVQGRVDFRALAEASAGFSGADLAAVINEGALIALRAKRPNVTNEDFRNGLVRVARGSVTSGKVLEGEERDRVCVYQSARVLVAAKCGWPVAAMSMLDGLGSSSAVIREEKPVAKSIDAYQRELAVLLSGRAGERLIFGDTSSLGERDLDQATRLAHHVAFRLGPENVGPRVLADAGQSDLGSAGDLLPSGPDLADQADRCVLELLSEAETTATKVLKTSAPQLRKLSGELSARETLTAKEVRAVVESRTRSRSNSA